MPESREEARNARFTKIILHDTETVWTSLFEKMGRQYVKPTLVLGENVAQALQFVQSGSAEVGVVALSLAIAPPVKDTGRYWIVPLDLYPRMEQGGVILRTAAGADLARAVRAFLIGDEGRAILKRYGFFLPGV